MSVIMGVMSVESIVVRRAKSRGAPGRAVLGVAAMVAAGLMLVTASGSASAETRTVVDERGPAQQTAPYQLTRGTLSYTAERTVLTAKIKRVSQKKTWVGGSIYYPDDSYLKVFTTNRQGVRVTRAFYYSDDGRVAVPAKAVWDYKRDRVSMIIDNQLHDPKPGNTVAALDLYTVTKGSMHGPLCGIEEDGSVTPCNDDYVAARLRR